MRMRRRELLRLGLWLLAASWMVLIFCFSAQTAEDSDETSDGVIRWLLISFDSDFPQLTPEEQVLRTEDLSFLVRKLAHCCLFAGLGFLLLGALLVDLPPRRAFPAAVGLGVLRGVLDELHQALVPGRSCELRDMAIDAAGVLLGAGALLVLVLIVRKKKR